MPHSSLPIAITSAIIFTGEAFIEGHALLIKDGKILDLVKMDQIPANFELQSCANHILAPAFIDCQVNGGDNILFNETPTAEAILQIAKAHRKTGTTRFLPTCITDTPEITQKAIAAMRIARSQDPSILGIHIEGPHISKEKKGMHCAKHIRPLTSNDMELYKREDDECFMITVAPESVSPKQIKALKDKGLIISLGHSAATAQKTHETLEAGATCFTHLFNGMPPLAGRDGGIAAVALSDSKSYSGIVLDGHHVSLEMVQMACAAKPKDKLFMVSDAIAPAGAAMPQTFTYNNETFIPKDGVCQDKTGILAGAMRTLGECVSIAIKELRLDPARVLNMASAVPASLLGLDDRFGKLLPNYTADIVALDHSFKTTAVWMDGKRVKCDYSTLI